jgi:hypothetical protein
LDIQNFDRELIALKFSGRLYSSIKDLYVQEKINRLGDLTKISDEVFLGFKGINKTKLKKFREAYPYDPE